MSQISRVRRLTAEQARRVAISSQRLHRAGVTATPAEGEVTTRHLMREARRLGVVQIDSVNVFARAHYMPLFSRLGPYSMGSLDKLGSARHQGFFEYWAHAAAFVPVDDWPLWQWRMQDHRIVAAREDSWAHENRRFLDWLLDYVHDHGAVTSSDVEHERNVRRGQWWGWSDVKQGLEHLFTTGQLAVAGRRGFEREYTTVERAIPSELREIEFTRDEAQLALTERAARSLGIFTEADLADYFRMKRADTRRALTSLIAQKQVRTVTVAGWEDPTWIWAGTSVPRASSTETDTVPARLLSPFDPLVWFRERLERMFDFHYRIEIYTPSARRIYGYYCLPFLLDNQIAGRVDLKSDRKNGRLLVQAAWAEPDAPEHSSQALAAALREAAVWQGLGDIEIASRGNLAEPLRQALG